MPAPKTARTIAEILSVKPRSISIADIGAAYYGQKPVYKSLLDASVARLYAFDADEKQASELRTLYPNETIFQHAIADGAGHTLYVCPAGMTSLLEPDPEALAFFNSFPEWGKVEKTIPVKTRKLDDIAELPNVDFLKIDIQGTELMALKDGRKKLAQCVAIQIEVSFITLYKNQPAFGEVDVELRAQGFIPHCFAELKQWSIAPTIRDGDPRVPFRQLLEADLVYVRNVIKVSELSSEQLRKLAVIAHFCYTSPDLVVRCIIELQKRKDAPAGAAQEYLTGLSA
ncbi:MAG: FkbM family methyltransferase [Hyphomicrobiales bacterium]